MKIFLFILAVCTLLTVVLVPKKRGNTAAVDAFSNYFGSKGPFLINYEGNGVVIKEWIADAGRRYKSIIYEDGKRRSTTIIEGLSVSELEENDRQVTHSRMTRGNSPVLLLALQDARSHSLEASSEDGETLQFEPTARSDGTYSLYLNRKTGTYEGFSVSDDSSNAHYQVTSIARVRRTTAANLFKLRRLDSGDKDPKQVSLGFSRKDIRTFKNFEPWWLGSQVASSRVETGTKYLINNEEALYLLYSDKKGDTVFEINEFSRRGEVATREWGVKRATTSTVIGGYRAKLQNVGGFLRALIKVDNALLRIDGYGFDDRRIFIQTIGNSLRQV